jgi:hypothetical protein
MPDIIAIPDHGSQLVDDAGRARSGFQILLDGLGLSLNSDRQELNAYTVATVPPAEKAYGFIMVTDESGGAVPAYTDLTNWRRVSDGAIIS